jgi:hypothetical protein
VFEILRYGKRRIQMNSTDDTPEYPGKELVSDETDSSEVREVDTGLTDSQAEDADIQKETESDFEASSASPQPKKRKRRGIKILVTVIAIFAILGVAGGGVYAGFHDEPAFCNAICHTPMDPYVASYIDGTSVNASQADSEAVLSVTLHKQASEQYGSEIKCLTCHESDLGEQIQEGMHWITGDYELPLEMSITVKQPKEGEDAKDGIEFCLREGCHKDISSLQDLQLATAENTRNPHQSHLGDKDCSSCHQTHEQSVNTCTQCHSDAPLPDGWLSHSDQQAQLQN